MDSERIREDMMRRAYLALLTGFVMTGCSGSGEHKAADSQKFAEEETTKPAMQPLAQEMKQEVKYLISPAGSGSVAPSEKAHSVYAAITAGMNESDIGRLLEPVLLESGTEHGAVGRRVYYCIGRNSQFWVEYQGLEKGGVAIRKSGLEAKSQWRRYSAGSIEIAPVVAGPSERLAGKQEMRQTVGNGNGVGEE